MIKHGSIRRVFPGGNTYKGFYSFYDYIIEQQSARKIIILKGGPGVGKSSFMKKIGKSMKERGFDVEYHHCSSDNNSVDGVVFHQIGVALVDGTAPHIVDPKNPGAVDEIINLGDYWDEKNMIKNKDIIISVNKEVGRLFKRAYGYLSAAKGVYDNLINNIDESIDYYKVNLIIEDLIKNIHGNIIRGKTLGKKRHLFGSAITPDGIKDYLESLVIPCNRIFILKGQYNSCQSYILEKISNATIEMGHNVEVYHNHFNPEQIDNIVIKDISVSITTSNRFEKESDDIIEIDECLNSNILKIRDKELNLDKEKFEDLISLAVKNINEAKKAHDRMEKYYIPNMDFNEIDTLKESTLERILSWI